MAAFCLCDAIGEFEYRTLPQACSELIAAGNDQHYEDGIMVTKQAWWHRWSTVRFAVIDEIGVADKNKVSGWKYDTLKDCVDNRVGLPLMVLSNLELDAIGQVYDERMVDRLGAGTLVELRGPSMRTGV